MFGIDDALIAAAITAAASAAGAAYTSNEARKQGGLQATLAQRAQDQQTRLADQQGEMARAGSIDARGNQMEYIPGVGWRTTLTPGSRAQLGASDAEENQRLNIDLPRSREGRTMNFQRRLREGSAADTEMRNYTGLEGRSQDALRGAMIERNVAAATDPVNRAKNSAQLMALRTNSNAAPAYADLARAGAGGTRTAIAEANLAAPAAYNSERSGVQGDTLNRENTLASRASNIDDLPFNPSNISDNLATSADRARAAAPSSLYGASTSLTRGSAPYLSAVGTVPIPNYGLMAGSAGESARLLLSAFQDRQTNKKDPWSGWQTTSSGGAP